MKQACIKLKTTEQKRSHERGSINTDEQNASSLSVMHTGILPFYSEKIKLTSVKATMY
ncbi:MAG: hypothetical protein JXB49_16500 [Bacteroidales bacterium]|nr:hypothetical protein [Bacteroidales bacterium]